jgi:hypothetical protein
MDPQKPKEKPKTEHPSREELIDMEWETLNELRKMLKDPDLTVVEKTHAASVLAYHANTLNKMLAQKGEKDQFNDQNLGDYLLGVEPRIARRFERDFTTWKKTLSYRRF